jgi:acetolactate synthase-1/2/3 large subunit
MRAADVLVQGLTQLGVRHVFGMPGSHSATVYDAMARVPDLATVLVRNEQAGAFAADGYARFTGRPGVICTTAGPGATNALSGVAEAWADSIPLVLLTGEVNADRLHEECGAYHEIDLEALFRPITKFCATVRDVRDTGRLLKQAFAATTAGRPRPAVLILPQDLMRAEAKPGVDDLGVPFQNPRLDLRELERAAGVLSRAERPIILAGGGALWAGAGGLVRQLSERLRAPVVTTLNGKGLIDERDPCSLGHARSVRAKALLPEADAMLAIGCPFTEVMTEWRRMPVPRNLVQIDIDATQVGMNHPVAVGIVGDAREALEGLVPLVPARDEGGWGARWERARTLRHPEPEWLIETLRDVLPDLAPVFTDACEIGYRMQTDYVVHGPRRLFYPSNYISLGWGFPAALGASVALAGLGHAVSVSGDGGFVMTAQELATASRYTLPVIAVIHNDSAYGAIKNIQKRLHDGRYRDVDLNNPNFRHLAGAFGIPATTAPDRELFATALREALDRPGPSVIEVPDRWRTLRI